MDRQTLIYIAVGLVAVLLLSNMMRSQSTLSAPVINLPGSSSSSNKDVAYYANQIAKIDFEGIGKAINTVFGKK